MIKKVRCVYGYYEKEVMVRYDRALKFKPYAQAGVRVDGDSVELVSYESTILRYNTSDRTLEFFATAPNYSRTTISHVSAFCAEYMNGFGYYDIKTMYKRSSNGKWQLSKRCDSAIDLTTEYFLKFNR